MTPALSHPEPRPVLLAAQSVPGRLWIAVFACAALFPGFGYLAPVFGAAIGLASFRPAWRRSIASALALVVCASGFSTVGLSNLVASNLSARTAVLALAWIAALLLWTRFVRRLPRGLARRSVVLLHALAAGLIVALWLTAARGSLNRLVAATLCGLVPELLWRTAYWMRWGLRQKEKAPIWSNLFAALPFLGAGGVPIGKGPAYFAAHEAHDAGRLASAQWEGVRLLGLALLWRFCGEFMRAVLWGAPSKWLPAGLASPRLPAMDALLRQPTTYPLILRWAGLYGELFHTMLVLAVFSHTIVGVFCLLGFHIPRNMKSPLLATTILDFWGRYFFYFKELLMDFCFFPVFLQSARLPVLWRTVLATAAAAFAGNLYYHVVLYWPLLTAGYPQAFESRILARVIYCALLTAGICGSFARSLATPKAAPASALKRRLFQAVLVSAFFALIHVWNFIGVGITVRNRWEFWKHLLPLP